MNRLRQILKDRRGVAFPLIIAIVLVLVMLMCCISEYFRLLIVAQGVRDAVQEAVISTVNDNYDDVYHGVREGYSGAYQPLAGDFEESLDYGDIYGRLDDILGLTYRGGYHAPSSTRLPRRKSSAGTTSPALMPGRKEKRSSSSLDTMPERSAVCSTPFLMTFRIKNTRRNIP